MKVIAKFKSTHSDPVEMRWCQNGDDLDVMTSVSQLLKLAKEQGPYTPALLEIRIEL